MTDNRTPILTELAERASVLYGRSVEAWLDCANLLLEARKVAARGEWGRFLEAAGIPERTAQNMLKIARAGLKPETVSGLGGIRATLEVLAAPGKESKLGHLEEQLFVARAEAARAHDKIDELEERLAIVAEGVDTEDPVYQRRLAGFEANRGQILNLTKRLHECQAGRASVEVEIKRARREIKRRESA